MNPPLSNPDAVDAHFHVFDAHGAQPNARYTPAYDAPLEAWQAQATSAGISRGVLVQPSFLGTDNRRLVQELQRHPETLRGVAVVPPHANRHELQALHSHGVRGIRLNLSGQSTDPDAWRLSPRLCDALGALRWHVEVHTDVGALPTVLAHLPRELPVVIDHMGKPDAVRSNDASVVAARQRSAAGGQVWVKLSGPYRLGGRDARALSRLWLGELGASALLWGSDWPFTNHEQSTHYGDLRTQLGDWLDEPARQAALTDNPHRLYWAA